MLFYEPPITDASLVPEYRLESEYRGLLFIHPPADLQHRRIKYLYTLPSSRLREKRLFSMSPQSTTDFQEAAPMSSASSPRSGMSTMAHPTSGPTERNSPIVPSIWSVIVWGSYGLK